MKALIIGAGIGGLATAIALRRAGITVEVYERSAGLHELGAGLSLWPNAIRALDLLGLAAALHAIGQPERLGRIYAWRGEILSEIPSAALEQRFGAPIIVVHRADLQALLYNTLDAAQVHFNAACVALTQDDQGVTARFADGATAQGDVLIGADGIRSVVRAQLHGAHPPRYAGYTGWRGIAPFDHRRWSARTAFESWGIGCRFGFAPIDDERVYWFATEDVPEGGADPPEGRKAALQRRFRGWHAPVAAVLAATPEAAILRNDIYDLAPLARWSVGRVTLLGDAAHATTPTLGQGACQALEDAVVLAQCLRAGGAGAMALQRYEARRLRHTNAVVRLSRRMGWVAEWQHPLACRLRNAVMKRIPTRLQLDQLAWILGHKL
jgi:2-polyprenyl-6-methoxyphenol hydroxylase-like FAD-dependent oxidoreductase